MTNLALVVSALLGAAQLNCGEFDFGYTPYDNLFNEVVKLDRAADRAWARCSTREELAARQSDVKEKTIASIGGFPEKTPLNARITGRIRKSGYTIEKILFESRPRHYVTAHLFLPDDAKFKPPYPGVVSPCGHSREGKNAPCYQRVGVVGALNGFATLVYDPIDQGERRQRAGLDWRGTVFGHNHAGYRANLLGLGTAQFRIWDGIRACDYLVSRTDVDASRLAVCGLSGGGTVSSYLNALDGRYTSAAPAGFISTMRDVYDNVGAQDAEQVLFAQAKIGFNHLGIISLRAPSPFLIVATHGDFFPFYGAVDTFENAKKVYSLLGAPESVSLAEASGPHQWYESTLNAAFAWIRRHSACDMKAWPPDFKALRRGDIGFAYTSGNSGVAFDGPEVMNVTETGCTLDVPGSRSVYDIMKDELSRLDASRPKPTAKSVREACGAKALSALEAEPAGLKEAAFADGKAISCVIVRSDDMVGIPFWAFVPDKTEKEPVLLLSDAPAAALDAKVRELLADGRAVAVAEMRGFGSTAKSRRPFYGSKRADEPLAMFSISIGENLVARRAEDAAVAARYFASIAGKSRIALQAYGAAAIPAAHAYALENAQFSSISLENPPSSWRDVVRRNDLAYAFADTVYGALKAYDWPQLLDLGE